jgi:hypothetical protein
MARFIAFSTTTENNSLELGGIYSIFLETDRKLITKLNNVARMPRRPHDRRKMVNSIDTSAFISKPKDSKDGR